MSFWALVCRDCARVAGELKLKGIIDVRLTRCAVCGVALPHHANGIVNGWPVRSEQLREIRKRRIGAELLADALFGVFEGK